MATTASPYGLKAVNHIGGTPYAGSTRLLPIANGYASNIYNGSIVSIVVGGTVEMVTVTGNGGGGTAAAFPAGTIGVFVGCTYSDPVTGNLTFSQYWPSGTAAGDAQAYIVDDPDVVFMAQANGAVTQADLGQNTHLAAVQSTTTGTIPAGNSNSAVTATTATTAAFAFRVVDFVDSPTSAVGDAFTDLLVKFNAGVHSYNNSTGI
jgi:hypothetical protein|tara:strand:+ start:325 stop:942 length:618 start_codon:yes stop_codon:yes gene_type:complete